MRVVHVITTLTTGGAERQLELLVGRSKHQTTTIALYAGGPVAASLRAAGHDVEVLDLAGRRRVLAPLLLVRALRRLRPDVVHVHLLSAQLWGIPAARLAGVPVVVSTEHSLMDDTIEGRPHTRWLRTLYRGLERLASHTIAVSATTAERLRRWGVRASRVSVSDNGIDFAGLAFDVDDRERVREELGLGPATTVIGAVGRLDPVKRVDVVLRATAPLLRDGAVLVVAGTGSQVAELRELAEELGIADAVRWLGARSDVRAVLSAVDVVVSASADETFGMAVVEALGNGLSVVYVEAPALDELSVRPGHAVRVAYARDPATEAELLAAALTEVLGRPSRRHPVPAVLPERYGADAAAARVEAVYDTLLRARG